MALHCEEGGPSPDRLSLSKPGSVEQLFQEGLAALGMAMSVMLLLGGCAIGPVALLRRRSGRGFAARALNDLVELAPIEPDAATLRTIVDLDPLTIAHDERHGADGTGMDWADIGDLQNADRRSSKCWRCGGTKI